MPPLQDTLRAETVVAHPPIEVWHAFTKPEHLYYWFGEADEIDLRVGGAYIVRGTCGIRLDTTVERLVEGRRLVLRPTRRGDDARIEIDLVKLTGAETRVCVADPDAENEAPWRGALENLASVWERGIDLRESRLPVMGIGPREIGPEERPLAGVPDGAGVRLGAVLAGGAAEKAGFMPGDVIVSFEGQVVRNGPDLVAAIRKLSPGSIAAVQAIRSGVQVGRSVTLGQRRGRGEPPPPPERLVREMRKAALDAGSRLESAVAGLSERDAYRPERPGAWSVAQTLAHLSITERMLQCWLDETARGGRPAIDSAPCTESSRIAGVLEGRPTIHDLLLRIQRDQVETISMLEHLPVGVASFKPRWGRVAFTALDYHVHSDDHLGQIRRIRKAIET
jgi:hypothetical protein